MVNTLEPDHSKADRRIIYEVAGLKHNEEEFKGNSSFSEDEITGYTHEEALRMSLVDDQR